jgi:predicted ATPase
VVAQLIAEGLEFTAPVTFLAGDNGAGKSTIIEAIADVCKINSAGGKAGTRYASTSPKTPLGQVMEAEFTAAGRRWAAGPRRNRKGFFLRAEPLFNLAQNVSGLPGFWDADLTLQSHGEGFLTVLEAMCAEPGIYLMDEPEAALSFTSCLGLISLLDRLAATGGQAVQAQVVGGPAWSERGGQVAVAGPVYLLDPGAQPGEVFPPFVGREFPPGRRRAWLVGAGVLRIGASELGG